MLLIVFFINTGCEYNMPKGLPISCDTTLVTFSGTVKPILSSNCIFCHNTGNAPLGVNLDNYSATKMQVNNGKLLGSITHSPGFIPMPKGGPKLRDCDISKIRKWITSGAPNN